MVIINWRHQKKYRINVLRVMVCVIDFYYVMKKLMDNLQRSKLSVIRVTAKALCGADRMNVKIDWVNDYCSNRRVLVIHLHEKEEVFHTASEVKNDDNIIEIIQTGLNALLAHYECDKKGTIVEAK